MANTEENAWCMSFSTLHSAALEHALEVWENTSNLG